MEPTKIAATTLCLALPGDADAIDALMKPDRQIRAVQPRHARR
jgi:hypothetical protein